MVAVMVSEWMSASRLRSSSNSCSALASACCVRWRAAQTASSSFEAAAESAALVTLAEAFECSA